MNGEAVILYNVPNDVTRSDVESLLSPSSLARIELRVIGIPERNKVIVYLGPGPNAEVTGALLDLHFFRN
jgi:hypothetical protein